MAKKIVKQAPVKVKAKACGCTTKCKGTIKVEKPFNKSQIIETIACRVGVNKKEAGAMMETLFEIISAHLKRRSGPGEFTLPGVAKLKIVNKPATKARKGINPFNGEPMTFAAKPARNIVKIKALKKLKDVAK